MSPNSKVFTESTEYIVDSETYGRPSAGNCKCVLQADTHELLLWNLGSGKFVSYNFLLSSVHKMTVGMAMNAIVSSRELSLNSIGLQTTFTVKDLDRSLTGFAKLMKFRKEDFQCNQCGDTPQYIVCNGKSVGPTRRKVDHLSEFDGLEGSKFKDFCQKKEKEGTLLKIC